MNNLHKISPQCIKPPREIFRITTLTCLYSNDSTYLLSKLMDNCRGKKHYILYSENSINTPQYDLFYIIVILRYGKEYKGYINRYKLVKPF